MRNIRAIEVINFIIFILFFKSTLRLFNMRFLGLSQALEIVVFQLQNFFLLIIDILYKKNYNEKNLLFHRK